MGKPFNIYLIVLFGVFSGCSSVSKPAHLNRAPQSVAYSDEFRAELRNVLESQIKTFPRAVSVYHYGQRGPDRFDAPRSPSGPNPYETPIELVPPEGRDYFRKFAGLFSTGALEDLVVGPGVYAATDPVQSERWGGKPWFLLEIRVPAGARYLDLRPREGINLPNAFVEKWFSSDKRFTDAPARGDYRMLRFTVLLGITELRPVITDLLRELKVDVLAYLWGQASTTVCLNVGYDITAFNFINPDFLDGPDRYRVYVQSLEVEATQEKRVAYARILRKLNASVVSLTLDVTPKTSISGGKKKVRMVESPVRWVEEYKIRVLVRGWAKTLGLPYLPPLVLKNPSEANALFEKLDHPTDPMGKLPLIDIAKFERSSDEDPTAPENDPVKHYMLEFDPMKNFEKSSPSEYAEVIQEIQASTFGCSKDYPNEPLPPNQPF
jgi:hypothetical protein